MLQSWLKRQLLGSSNSGVMEKKDFERFFANISGSIQPISVNFLFEIEERTGKQCCRSSQNLLAPIGTEV